MMNRGSPNLPAREAVCGPSKVLFLGAGASARAGYPLANDLLSTIEKSAVQSTLTIQKAWQKWRLFRDAARGPLALALQHKNPEIVLSQIDLLETTRGHFADSFRKEKADKAFQMMLADEKIPSEYFKSTADEEISRVNEVRYRLIDCLEDFFRWRHNLDSMEENRPLRDYLRKYLSCLSDSDLVITLNWDSTAERSLAEIGKWSPLDGYGFERDLLLKSGLDPEPLPAGCRGLTSAIKVLKLHGSVGWHLTKDRRIYFSNPYFLNRFNFNYNNQPLPLFDPLAPQLGPDRSRVLAYPSFLKRLEGVEMQSLWHSAAKALETAQEVEFVGYSLPESDLAIRVLLGTLRFRLECGKVSVTVRDPNGMVFDRWRTFLGKQIKRDKSPL
jgi:hypothetical protein